MKKLFACALAAVMMLAAGCGSSSSTSTPSAASPAAPAASQAAGSEAAGGAAFATVTPGKFTIGMECAYAPFNWTQLEKTDMAVDIGSASYADGYDVVMGKHIAEQLGLELVVKPIAWEGLEPAVNNGEIDAIIAGMTATPERRENVDFTDPYYESKMVVIVRKDSDLTNITSIQDLSGRKVQGQLNTLYDTVIDQIEGVDHVTPLATYPLMVVALQSGEVDALTAELPVAAGVVAGNSDLTYIEFAEGSGFEADTSVSIAVKKGNTALLDAIQGALASVSEEDRQQWMIDATGRQPAQE
ncbi:transporter substrate-binding domain-containing protein [Anaerotruncus colihominis]|nr:transporter substrate-binding domain-containing protein [Anaerotruncus colihominis]MCR2024663.1 transporter substrate-binding domain-containing protein [Anaerotruncus colihominis]